MKHFRDLVLSTKEPVLHNVLWIKPIGVATYRVYMYEDGWQLLFGGSNGEGGGISYEILETRPDGYIVQFIDNSDPTNKKNLYPKTKAIQVWLSNGINVEQAIANINNTLSNLSSMIKKANFVTIEQLNNNTLSKSHKTFWVYNYHNSDTEEYRGEGFLRKYTTEREYTTISLSAADIVMDITNASTKLGYVESIVREPLPSTNKTAIIKIVATMEDVHTAINQLTNRLINDVRVDGDSVVTNGIANIPRSKRMVYIVTSDIFDSDYPEGESRADKTFLIRQMQGSEPNDSTMLIKYTNSGLQQDSTTINLVHGDLLFNVDDHSNNNDDIIPYTLYIYDTPTQSKKVHPIATKSLVERWLSDSIEVATDSVKPVFIDFVASNERQAGNYTTWDISTNASMTQIEEQVALDKIVYARVTGIDNQGYRDIPKYLPVGYCANGFAIFASSNINKVYSLQGRGTTGTGWQFRELVIQPKLTFDDAPTQGSNNPVKSGGIYSALEEKADTTDLKDYVLREKTSNYQFTSYNDRMKVTPKMQKAEWIVTEPDENGYILWTQEKEEAGTTPRSRFESMWWAVYNNYKMSDIETYQTKLIVMYGNVACYCSSDDMTDVDNASTIELRFFDGRKVTTYVLNKEQDTYRNIIIRVVTRVDQLIQETQFAPATTAGPEN